jgi:hypothetical protein
MIDYDGKRFRPTGAVPGEEQRIATYHQDGDLLWGEFHGGHARRGGLTGVCAADGSLEFAYCMVLASGEIVSGHCASTPHLLPDGRIRLDEVWQRYGPHAATGVSHLEEIPAEPAPAPTTYDEMVRQP